MSTRIEAYWQTVQQQRATLPEGDEIFLTSIPSVNHPGHKPGVVCSATREVAATSIASGTHRIARPEEVEQFHADAAERSAKHAEEELARKQQFQLPPTLDKLVTALLANATPGAAAPQPDKKK